MTRNYWSPRVREALHNGHLKVDQDDLVSAYREWRNEDVVLTFVHEGGEEIDILGSKRGNGPYARKKRKKMRELESGMEGLVWDYDVQGARRHVMRKTHLLFITLTFDRSHSIQESWRLCSSRGGALNKFSANLAKILGNKATFKAKEAQSSGYAAPHILCIIDRPVTAIQHKGRWIVQSRDIVERIKRAWPYGFVDIQASVGGKVRGRGVMAYMMKYVTKTTSVDYLEPKHLKIAELTHSWNKLFGLRDVVSKQFMQRLNVHLTAPVVEDSPSGWELQQIEYNSDVILVAQREGWGVFRPPDPVNFVVS